MPALLSITESNVLQALGDFIVATTGIVVVQGQDNRVAEPGAADFATMWPTLRERLETNTDSTQDITLVGSTAGTVLTVTAISGGVLQVGSPLYGVAVASGSSVAAFLTGTGGLGTYTIAPAQSLSSRALQAGLAHALAPMRVTVQVDVHGPNSTDNTQRLVTLFRDPYGCDFFTAEGFEIAPLYIDDGSQVPFINGEGQYEDRWVLLAKLQINPIISTGQQFTTSIVTGIIDVDVEYPP